MKTTNCLRPVLLYRCARDCQTRLQAVLAADLASQSPVGSLLMFDVETPALLPQPADAAGPLSPAAAFSAQRLRHAKLAAAVV